MRVGGGRQRHFWLLFSVSWVFFGVFLCHAHNNNDIYSSDNNNNNNSDNDDNGALFSHEQRASDF